MPVSQYFQLHDRPQEPLPQQPLALRVNGRSACNISYIRRS
jgi:hypothetical protein